MLLLLLDTTSSRVSIGLAEAESIIVQKTWEAEKNLAEGLAPRIQELLRGAEKNPAELQRIVVHSGPGGFSTLRIGVTTANALGYALGIPVQGIEGEISSLEELLRRAARAHAKEGEWIVPVYSQPPHLGRLPSAL